MLFGVIIFFFLIMLKKLRSKQHCNFEMLLERQRVTCLSNIKAIVEKLVILRYFNHTLQVRF